MREDTMSVRQIFHFSICATESSAIGNAASSHAITAIYFHAEQLNCSRLRAQIVTFQKYFFYFAQHIA